MQSHLPTTPCQQHNVREDPSVPIDYVKRDGVAYITLNNPTKANILDKPTSDAISDAWIDLWEDRHIRCAIVTGAGDRHFCGGHNLAPRPDLTAEDREYLRTQRIYWPLAGTVHGQRTGVDGRMGDHYPRVWKPVIAAINGWAAGGPARHIVTLPPAAVRMMKEFVIRFGNLPDDQAWHVQNLMNSLLMQTTMDAEEGRTAFNEKRPPHYTGTLRKRGEPWPEPSEEDARRLDDAYRSGEY